MVFVGPIASVDQAAKFYDHQVTQARRGMGAQSSQQQATVVSPVQHPRSHSKLGAAAAATAAFAAQIGRRPFGRNSSSPHAPHHVADLPHLLDRSALELTPQLASADGQLFISTTSVAARPLHIPSKGSRYDSSNAAKHLLSQVMLFARRNQGTVASVLWNASEILQCMGGVRILFPLFAQLNLRNPNIPASQPNVVDPDILLRTLDLMVCGSSIVTRGF